MRFNKYFKNIFKFSNKSNKRIVCCILKLTNLNNIRMQIFYHRFNIKSKVNKNLILNIDEIL